MSPLFTLILLALLIFFACQNETLRERYRPLPNYAKVLIWVVVAFTVAAITDGAGSALVTFLKIGVLILAFGGAGWAGDAVYQKLRYKNERLGVVLATLVAVSIFLLVGRGFYHVFAELPGVGWQFRS